MLVSVYNIAFKSFFYLWLCEDNQYREWLFLHSVLSNMHALRKWILRDKQWVLHGQLVGGDP